MASTSNTRSVMYTKSNFIGELQSNPCPDEFVEVCLSDSDEECNYEERESRGTLRQYKFILCFIIIIIFILIVAFFFG